MAALWQRDRAGGDGRGRTLDVALTEAVLSMMEGMLPEYGALGLVRQPTGSRIPTAAPSNAYPTADGKWILIAANSDPLFAKLAALMGSRTSPATRALLAIGPGCRTSTSSTASLAPGPDSSPPPRWTGAERGRHAPRSTPRPNARPTRSSGIAAWCARSRTRLRPGDPPHRHRAARARRSRRRALAGPAGRRAHGRGLARAARPAAGRDRGAPAGRRI